MAFSHLRFREQLTHEKPRSRHAPGDRTQKSERETWPLLPHPSSSQYPAELYSRYKENIYTKTEREDGEPV